MKYALRDQCGRYVKILEYGHNAHGIKLLDHIHDEEPSLFKDDWEVRAAIVILNQINVIRTQELEEIKRTGIKVSPELAEKLGEIKVTRVEYNG